MIDAVLLVGNYMPSLAVARSLAAAGYRVIAGDGGEYATVYWSRSCHETWPHPPVTKPDEFLAALASFVEERPDLAVIVPLQARYVALLAAERRRVPDGPRLAMPDPGTVLTCIDKTAMYEVAHRVGVPVQPWAVARDLDELVATAAEVGWPCVVRPTRDAAGPLSGDVKAIICADEAELRAGVPAWPPKPMELLVQRFASGGRVNVTFAAQRGRVKALVQVRTLRSSRLDGTGLGVDSVSEPLETGLADHVAALIGALDYTGVGSTQWIVPRRGDPSFLELNPRIGLSVGRMQHLGLDLPRAACELARDDREWQPPHATAYRTGKRIAWTSRDLHSLRMALRRGEIDRRQAARWLGRALVTAVRSDYHMTLDLRDPMPTIVLYRDLARIFIRPAD